MIKSWNCRIRQNTQRGDYNIVSVQQSVWQDLAGPLHAQLWQMWQQREKTQFESISNGEQDFKCAVRDEQWKSFWCWRKWWKFPQSWTGSRAEGTVNNQCMCYSRAMCLFLVLWNSSASKMGCWVLHISISYLIRLQGFTALSQNLITVLTPSPYTNLDNHTTFYI